MLIRHRSPVTAYDLPLCPSLEAFRGKRRAGHTGANLLERQFTGVEHRPQKARSRSRLLLQAVGAE
jgi:hypothetical protein